MPPKRATRAASQESTPAPRRSTRQASRDATPTPQPVTAASQRRRVTRSQSPLKQGPQQPLPKVQGAGSNAYGAGGRTQLALPVTEGNSTSGFEDDLESKVNAALNDAAEALPSSEDDDLTNFAFAGPRRRPATIHEEEEEEEEEEKEEEEEEEEEDPASSEFTPSQEEGEEGDEEMVAVQSLSKRKLILPTPGNESTTYQREEIYTEAAGQAQGEQRSQAAEGGVSAQTQHPRRSPRSRRSAQPAQGAQEAELEERAPLFVYITNAINRIRPFVSMKYATPLLIFLLAFLSTLSYPVLCKSGESSLCFPGAEGRTLLDVVKYAADNTWSKIPSLRVNSGNESSEMFSGSFSRRVASLESTVKGLHKASQLHESSRRKLDMILPDVIVVSKNRDGRLEIPAQFWQALKDKIEQDFGNKFDAPIWDSFLANNEVQLNELLNKEVEDQVQKALVKERIISRDAFTKLLEENFVSHSDLISREKENLRKQFQTALSELDASARASAGRIFEDKMRNLPAMQLSSVAAANLIANTDIAIRTVNFFSPGQGAVIDPYLTSPTARRHHPASRFHPKRLYERVLGITGSNQPLTALSHWNEAGDCWCAASKAELSDARLDSSSSISNGHGRGGRAQLGVRLGQRIFPTKFTIEHIPRGGTLEIDAAPREIELWVEISDAAARARISAVADSVFQRRSLARDRWARSSQPDAVEAIDLTARDMPPSFVRVGAFEYDIHGMNHVQTFALDILLEEYGVSIDRALVRVLDNWGRDYTCIYRMRLHGEPAGAAKATDSVKSL